MIIEEIYIEGCFIIKPDVYKDNRGAFFESYRKSFMEEGIGRQIEFVQENQSISKKGVLRGFHFQEGEYSQAKLVRVVKGEVIDVIVDLRRESITFGKHYKVILNDKNNYQLFIPRGFAHAFLALSDEAVFSYKCDNYYNKASERGILYSDKTLNINWEYPHEKIIVSKKDKILPTFEEILT
ncbi:dTDP-4-dehydrorhamnose 3,5-epimerase [Leptobacterium sp. I13]|uniref:dTDP-4-dehydrorhamnose 3,5-epimerase n=1 Tax=Leptobacterium meishanense TaxID=3128904 RepID=UPI0030EB6D2A